jgi:hypothetical protein
VARTGFVARLLSSAARTTLIATILMLGFREAIGVITVTAR